MTRFQRYYYIYSDGRKAFGYHARNLDNAKEVVKKKIRHSKELPSGTVVKAPPNTF